MITIYGKPGCPQCDQAKAMSQSHSWLYNYIELDLGQQRRDNIEYISRDQFQMLFPDARSVPQIVVNNTHVGGFKEFQSYIKERANDGI